MKFFCRKIKRQQITDIKAFHDTKMVFCFAPHATTFSFLGQKENMEKEKTIQPTKCLSCSTCLLTETHIPLRVQLRFLTLAVFVSPGILKGEFLPRHQVSAIPVEKLRVRVVFFGQRNAAYLSLRSRMLRLPVLPKLTELVEVQRWQIEVWRRRRVLRFPENNTNED